LEWRFAESWGIAGEILRCAPFLRQGTQDDGMSLSGMLGVLAGVEKKFQIAFGAEEAAGF
jgi:hypothetical protein